MEKDSPDSPETLKDTPDSPDNANDSPESPQQEEMIFFEDRKPENFSPSSSRNNSQPANSSFNGFENPEDFIVLDSIGESNLNSSQTDSSDSEVEENAALKGTDDQHKNETDSSFFDDLCLVVEDRNPQLSGNEIQTPFYTINENILNAQNPPRKKNKFANQCFNCGETTHALRDCPQPRNHAEINRKRREFQDSKGSERVVYKRYHVEVEEEEQFNHLQPGELSGELREALGLGHDELPSYIYRMRSLGYPPGWLEEAAVAQSGIAMFDGHGNEVATPGSKNGVVSDHGVREKYDSRKFIRFPGFNVPPLPGTHDDYEYYRSPPMSRQQSLEVMVERLGSQVVGGYKRKRLSLNTGRNGALEETTCSLQDMEYEETPESGELPVDNCKFVPPLPDTGDSEPPPPPPGTIPDDLLVNGQPSPGTPGVTESNMSADSSLEDLEEQKRALLAQLNDTSPLCGTPNNSIGKTKTVDLGTPILKSVSPYARLPSADKFSVNICDVINFENLPDSTGKYEQMSGLIKKVRTQLSKLQKEQ